MFAVAILFYAGCLMALQAKRRPSARWTSARERRIECIVLATLWLVFFQAFAGRPLQSWLFVVLAIGLLYSFLRYVVSGTSCPACRTPEKGPYPFSPVMARFGTSGRPVLAIF